MAPKAPTGASLAASAPPIKRTLSAPSGLVLADTQSLLHHALPAGVSKYSASLMLFKAILGAGLFALPYATKLLGIGGVTLAMFLCGWLAYYCSTVLVRVHDVVMRDTLQRHLTYVSLTHHCFGPRVSRLVYFLQVFTTIGSLGAYLILIGKTLASVWPVVPSLAFSGLAACVVLPFCLANNTKFLSYTAVVGNLAVAVVIVAVLVRGAEITQGILPAAGYAPHFRSETFPQAFGIVGFVWTCTTTVITVEKAMKRRADFAAAFRLTTWVVFFLGTAFGVVNYLYFAEDTCSIVVLNLGDSPLALVAKLAIALDLSFSYPLALAPAREIVEKSLLDNSSPYLDLKRKGIRVVIVFLTWLLCFVPSFGVVLNIVGGWSASILCFILPPLMLLQVRRFHVAAHDAQTAYLKSKGGGGGLGGHGPVASPAGAAADDHAGGGGLLLHHGGNRVDASRAALEQAADRAPEVLHSSGATGRSQKVVGVDPQHHAPPPAVATLDAHMSSSSSSSSVRALFGFAGALRRRGQPAVIDVEHRVVSASHLVAAPSSSTATATDAGRERADSDHHARRVVVFSDDQGPPQELSPSSSSSSSSPAAPPREGLLVTSAVVTGRGAIVDGTTVVSRVVVGETGGVASGRADETSTDGAAVGLPLEEGEGSGAPSSTSKVIPDGDGGDHDHDHHRHLPFGGNTHAIAFHPLTGTMRVIIASVVSSAARHDVGTQHVLPSASAPADLGETAALAAKDGAADRSSSGTRKQHGGGVGASSTPGGGGGGGGAGAGAGPGAGPGAGASLASGNCLM
jgi:amino acid permease